MSKISDYHISFQKRRTYVKDQLVFSLFFQRYQKGYLVDNLEFFDNILSKFQFGFRKGYGTQNCLLQMLEIWKEATDNNKAFGGILTNLSKAFDC